MPPNTEWVVNSYRWIVLAREARYRMIALSGTVFFAAESAALVSLFEGIWNPSHGIGLTVIGLWSVALLVFSSGIVLILKPVSDWTPTRVGFSGDGLEVEYDPRFATRRQRSRPNSSRRLLSPSLVLWKDVKGVLKDWTVADEPSRFGGLGPPPGVSFRSISNAYVQISPVSTEIVRRIRLEASTRGIPSVD